MTAEVQVLGYPHHFYDAAECLGDDGVFFQQGLDDCGVACTKMILDHFGEKVDYSRLCRHLRGSPEGTTMLDLKRLAETYGLICEGWHLGLADLKEIPLPAVLLLRRRHFVVLQALAGKRAILLDPVLGKLGVPALRLAALWNGETLLFVRRESAARRRAWFPEPITADGSEVARRQSAAVR